MLCPFIRILNSWASGFQISIEIWTNFFFTIQNQDKYCFQIPLRINFLWLSSLGWPIHPTSTQVLGIRFRRPHQRPVDLPLHQRQLRSSLAPLGIPRQILPANHVPKSLPDSQIYRKFRTSLAPCWSTPHSNCYTGCPRHRVQLSSRRSDTAGRLFRRLRSSQIRPESRSKPGRYQSNGAQTTQGGRRRKGTSVSLRHSKKDRHYVGVW